MTWHLIGRRSAEPLAQSRPDVRVGFAGLRRGGVAPGADRPDRLVGDDEPGDLIAGQAVEARLDLAIEHRQRFVALPFVERFSDADDRGQLRAERRQQLCD